jgi:hypothetical protein
MFGMQESGKMLEGRVSAWPASGRTTAVQDWAGGG